MSRTIDTGILRVEDRNDWYCGFAGQAETWNGRLVMIGFISAVLVELFSNQEVLHFWNLI